MALDFYLYGVYIITIGSWSTQREKKLQKSLIITFSTNNIKMISKILFLFELEAKFRLIK